MVDRRYIGLLSIFTTSVITVYLPKVSITPEPKLTSNSVYKSGDYIIGGIFSLHTQITQANSSSCYSFNDVGLAAAEAMMYTINRISNSSLLPNITIGYDLRDDCNSLIRSVEAAFDFLSKPGSVPLYPMWRHDRHESSMNSTEENTGNFMKPMLTEQAVVAVIGPANSDQSLVTSSLFSTVLLPQISYSASSEILSDKNIFTSFFRVVPNDWEQVKAMVDIFLHMNWTYISILGSDTSYGRLGISLLEYEASKMNIKIAMKKTFSYISAPQVAEDITEYIESNPIASQSKVYVIFASTHDAYRLLKIFQNCNFSDITFFASESWTLNESILDIDPDVIEGTLGLRPFSETPISYQSYLDNMTLTDANELDSWFQEYLLIKNICSNVYNTYHVSQNESFKKMCLHQMETTKNSKVLINYFQLKKVPFVLDAVYAIVHALHKVLCNNTSCIKKFISNEELLEKIKETRFDGYSGSIKFNEYGDISGAFTLFNIQKNSNGKLWYRQVGQWNHSLLFMNHEHIVWKGGVAEVISRCNQPCLPGTRLNLGSDNECWRCIRCGEGQFTKTNNLATCKNCTKYYGVEWGSNENHTSCKKLPQKFISWGGDFAIISLLSSFICVLITLSVLCFFVKYRKSNIVKGSNRELTYVLFVSLFLSLFSPYMYIGRPTDIRCMLQPNYLSFVKSSTVLVIYFKTDRILYIFNAKPTTIENLHQEKRKRDRFQILLFLVIEIIICGSLAVSTYFHRPLAYFISVQQSYVLISCSEPWYHQHMLAFSWFTILIIASIYKAYRVRKLPENFNEATQISFTLFVLFLIWLLVAVTITNEFSHHLCSTYICIATQIHTLIVLVFMLIPKLRIIIFQPTKNSTEAVRMQTMEYMIRKHSKVPSFETVSTINV